MPRQFAPARKSSGAFEVRNALVESSATIVKGAPLARDNTNTDEVLEHAGGNTVTGIVGVAGEDATAGTPEFGPDLLYYVASQEVEFVGQVINGGTVQTISTTPGEFEGNEYGIIKDGGEWYVDGADEVDVVLRVTKEIPEINAVLFKFIASAIID